MKLPIDLIFIIIIQFNQQLFFLQKIITSSSYLSNLPQMTEHLALNNENNQSTTRYIDWIQPFFNSTTLTQELSASFPQVIHDIFEWKKIGASNISQVKIYIGDNLFLQALPLINIVQQLPILKSFTSIKFINVKRIQLPNCSIYNIEQLSNMLCPNLEQINVSQNLFVNVSGMKKSYFKCLEKFSCQMAIINDERLLKDLGRGNLKKMNKIQISCSLDRNNIQNQKSYDYWFQILVRLQTFLQVANLKQQQKQFVNYAGDYQYHKPHSNLLKPPSLKMFQILSQFGWNI